MTYLDETYLFRLSPPHLFTPYFLAILLYASNLIFKSFQNVLFYFKFKPVPFLNNRGVLEMSSSEKYVIVSKKSMADIFGTKLIVSSAGTNGKKSFILIKIFHF